MLVAGAISFDAGPKSSALAESIASTSACFDHLTTRKIHDANGVTLYLIERAAEKPPIIRGDDTSEGRHTWLVGDVSYTPLGSSKMLLSREFDRNLTPDETAIWGRWTALQVSNEPSTLRLRTDMLGIQWLYLASIPGGFVLANDFTALAKNLPRPLTVDRESLVLELVLSYVPDDRTLFQEINVVPPGALVELGPRGMKVLDRPSPSYGDEFVGWSEERKFEALDEIYDSITSKYLNAFERPLVLSISAGFDSRYGLALLEKQGIDASLCTFGDPSSLEVLDAIAVCKRVGRQTAVFPCTETHWDQWIRSTTFLGITGLIQWNGWAEDWFHFQREFGGATLIGYLGDALTGKHLGHRLVDDWVAFWSSWSTKDGWATSSALRRPTRRKSEEVVNRRLASSLDGASFCFPHQRALHLDLYGRQRRRVACQANLMSRFLTPVLFFYNRDLIHFWSNLPVGDLLHQRLYQRYAASRFPQLFSGRERQPVSSGPMIRRISRRVARRIRGQNEDSRPPVIDRWRVLSRERSQILELSRRVEPMITELIDVSAFRRAMDEGETSRILSTHDLIRGVNLFQLLEECCKSV